MTFIFEDKEVKYRSIARWELPHHLLDGLGRYVFYGWILLFCHIVDTLSDERQFLMVVVPDEVQCCVHCNPGGPGLEGACPSVLEVRDVGDDADECLLQYVAGILLVNDISCADGFQVGDIQGTEHPHRIVISVANLLCQMLFVVTLSCI